MQDHLKPLEDLLKRLTDIERRLMSIEHEFQQFRIQNYDIVKGKSDCREALIKINKFDERISRLENELASE